MHCDTLPDFPFTRIEEEDLREKTYARCLCGIVADVSIPTDLHTNCIPPAAVAQCTSGCGDSGCPDAAGSHPVRGHVTHSCARQLKPDAQHCPAGYGLTIPDGGTIAGGHN